MNPGVSAGDEASAALKRDVSPEPIEDDDQPIAEADQEINVDRAPEEPRKASRQTHEAEIGHRRFSSDCGEIAEVAITKSAGPGGALGVGDDRPGDEAPLLLCHWRHAGKRFSHRIPRMRGVADDENVA